MLPLSGLSPVAGKKVVVNFDGGLLSSDGGILVLREVEQRLRVADRMAACLVDPRAPDQITHTLAAIMRFRLLIGVVLIRHQNHTPNQYLKPHPPACAE
jgi:hypothetical protein